MSWNKLAPIVATTGRPMTSASIVVNKDGVPKVSLVFSASIHEEYGERTRVDISAGGGEHKGSLLIEFTPAGDFEIKLFGKGGGRVFVPIGEGVPGKPASNQPCVLGERTADSLVVKLPVAEWDREINARVRTDRATPARPPSAAAPKVGNGKALDVVDYLTGKGVRIARLAGNRFQLNGETVLIGQVLKAVNDHRRAADLDPLAATQVW